MEEHRGRHEGPLPHRRQQESEPGRERESHPAGRRATQVAVPGAPRRSALARRPRDCDGAHRRGSSNPLTSGRNRARQPRPSWRMPVTCIDTKPGARRTGRFDRFAFGAYPSFGEAPTSLVSTVGKASASRTTKPRRGARPRSSDRRPGRLGMRTSSATSTTSAPANSPWRCRTEPAPFRGPEQARTDQRRIKRREKP